MTRRRLTVKQLLLPLLLNAAAIASVASFATSPLTSTSSLQHQSLRQQHHAPLLARRTSSLHVATDIEAELDIPELGNDGVYHIMDERQYKALLEDSQDKLIVLKFFAPWCKACKGLEPKFNALVRDKKYDNLPIVWADLSIQGNKDFVKSVGVLALPSIQLYSRSQILDTFPCGPSKVPILKRKLTQLVNDQIDANTLQLKEVSSDTATMVPDTQSEDATATPAIATAVATPATRSFEDDIKAKTAAAAPKHDEESDFEKFLQRNKSMLRSNKYLAELLESEFETLLSKANMLTFESGSVIMKEGNPGRAFYVILDGEIEICQHASFEDPLTTPPSYLGTVINRQDTIGDYFGERSLITGEPRAASLRAVSRTQCLVFDKDDFPRTSVLSGRSALIDDVSKEAVLDEVNDKYGVALSDVNQLNGQKQYQDSILSSQVRGSVNTPNAIDGVDNDIEVPDDVQEEVAPVVWEATTEGKTADEPGSSLGVETSTIVPLLMRFKLIRCITRCFDYIVQNRLRFGESGTLRRRSILANMLSPTQMQSITDAFKLVDEDGDGEITLMELRRIMIPLGEEHSDEALLDLIESSHFSAMDGEKIITEEDFTGLMAEVEIYHLFLDTFKAMDTKNSGFVRAKDLDRVLCGVRDLISDDRHSIIDVEDQEMMVDYEQFSRMLLGTSLKV